MRIEQILNSKKELTISDLNDLPIWALERYCQRHNVCVKVNDGKIVGIGGGY